MAFNTGRIGFAALLALALTGCGVGPLASGTARVDTGLRAAADVPGIEEQIRKETLGTDEYGTKVKALPKPAAAKPVTFLTYKALDNNLGILVDPHLNTLERVGSSARVNALALLDDIGPNNTRRYYLRQDADRTNVTSPYEHIGERNTGAAKSLKEAVKWGFGTYPSKLRWLDINSHGGGYKGIAQDDEAEGLLTLPALGAALKSSVGTKPLDVISFDACLMATLEVAYELRGTARYMVGSEDESYALGLNVDQVLGKLATGAEPEAEALAKTLVLTAQRTGKNTVKRGTQKTNKAFYTISALDLSKAERVTAAVDRLAVALLAALPREGAAIKLALTHARPFYVTSNGGHDFEQRDLNEVLDQLAMRVKDPAVVEACKAANATLFNRNGLVVLARSTAEQKNVTRGVSIYAPANGQVDPEYKASAFAKATRWDELLAALK